MKKIVLGLVCFLVLVGGLWARTRIGGDAWVITDKDGMSTAGYTYTSYQLSSEWYIVKASTYTWRYRQGTGNYDLFWSSRTQINYYEPDEVDSYRTTVP